MKHGLNFDWRAVSRNAEHMTRDVARITQTLTPLTPAVIAGLARRAGKSEPPSRSGDKVGVAKGTHSDPTATAVIQSMSSKKVDDAVYEAVKSIAVDLKAMADLAMHIDQKVRFVTETAQRAKDSDIIYCGACNREVAGTSADRLRSGYCRSDYERWVRLGKPYRATFEAQTPKVA